MKKLFIVFCFIVFTGCLSAQVSIINQNNPTCPGMCNGSVTFSISGGIAPYTITSLGTSTCTLPPFPPVMSNTITINGLCACAYNFLVTDATMTMIGAQMVTMITPPPMNAIFTKTNVCCNGNCNGTVAAIVVGGSMPYTYSWSPMVGTTPTVTNLCAGTYSLKVSDAMGCNATYTTQITQPAMFALTSSVIATSCSTCCTGLINVTGSGGQPGYTYTVFPGNLTNATGTFSNLCAGAYSVCASDAGCCSTCIGVVVNAATTTAIADLQSVGTIVFYPNPSNGLIKTNYKGSVNYSVEILDVLGGLVYKDKLSEQINLCKQQEGIYFVVVKDSESRVLTRQRIIIHH